MMGALPQTAPTLSPLFAGLVPAMPGATGEEGGFDLLIAGQAEAAAPAAAATGAMRFAAPVFAAPVAAEQSAPAPTGEAAVPALPVAKPMIQVAAQPDLEAGLPTTEPKAATKPEAAPAEDAVTVANWLLGTAGRFALNGAAQPGKTPVAAKPGESETGEEGAAKSEAETVDATLPIALPVAAAPAADRPVKADAPKAAASRDDAPVLPMAAPKPRDAAIAMPALATAETPAAKPAAEPSMTVLFAQPAAQAGGVAEAAKPAIVAERVLDMTSDDAWIEQLASDIAATKSASNDVSFRLMPRHLGRLDVSMMMGDEGMSLKLDTQHEATATIVTAAQVRLVDDLRQQGVRVADTQVTHTPTDAGRQSQQGQGRSPAQDAAHLIETATERDARSETRDQERAGDRRGRFA